MNPVLARRVVPALVLIFLFVSLSSVSIGSSIPANPPLSTRPNIVLILTDDQSLALDSMDFMPIVESLLANEGMTFSNLFVSTPLCCPARATLLRGQYVHNHEIYYNVPPLGGFEKFYGLGLENETVATALQDSGYRTVLIGKYLNNYPLPDNPTYIPPGWNEWYVPITNSAYSSYNYQMNENGEITYYGWQPDDYITDVLSQKAVDFISTTTVISPGVPFFSFVSVYAPHAPANPAPRHEHLFPDAQAPRTPSFNEADLRDKPNWMQAFSLLTATEIEEMDSLYRDQMRSLQAVDELVEDVVDVLGRTGQLENTFIIFSSDNGLHMGQHRFQAGKGTPYEEDIRAPLIVRGPGVQAGTVRQELVNLVDLAPTMTEIAGTTMPFDPDGFSLLPLLQSTGPPASWRNVILIEHWRPLAAHRLSNPFEPFDDFDRQLSQHSQEVPDYTGLRTLDFKLIERLGGRELYAISDDPYEIFSQHDIVDPTFLSQAQTWLEDIRQCIGETCRSLESQPPPPLELRFRREDVDRSGEVDLDDLIEAAGCWHEPVGDICGDRQDVNYDAQVDVRDVMRVAAAWMAPLHVRAQTR